MRRCFILVGGIEVGGIEVRGIWFGLFGPGCPVRGVWSGVSGLGCLVWVVRSGGTMRYARKCGRIAESTVLRVCVGRNLSYCERALQCNMFAMQIAFAQTSSSLSSF